MTDNQGQGEWRVIPAVREGVSGYDVVTVGEDPKIVRFVVNYQDLRDTQADLTAQSQELEDVKAKNEELEALFDLQWKRDIEAVQRWQAESPEDRALVHPDRGKLLDWLHDVNTAQSQEIEQLKREVELWKKRAADEAKATLKAGVAMQKFQQRLRLAEAALTPPQEGRDELQGN